MASNINNTTTVQIQCIQGTHFAFQNIGIISPSFYTNVVCFAVLNGLAALPTFSINLLVVWTVLESPRLRAFNYNIFVAILSLTDMLTGLVVQPLYISFSVCYLSNCSHFCELKTAYVVTGMLTGRLSLFALALVSSKPHQKPQKNHIQNPLTYSDNSSSGQKITTIVVVGWLFIITTVAVQNIQHPGSVALRKIIGFVILVPLSAIIVFSSFRVYVIARSQQRAIAVQMGAVHPTSSQSRKTESKRNSTLLLGLLAYALLYLPLTVVKVVETATKPEYWTTEYGYHAAAFWVTCLHLQSFINPLIYAIRLSDIRRGMERKFPCFQKPLLLQSKMMTSSDTPYYINAELQAERTETLHQIGEHRSQNGQKFDTVDARHQTMIVE